MGRQRQASYLSSYIEKIAGVERNRLIGLNGWKSMCLVWWMVCSSIGVPNGHLAVRVLFLRGQNALVLDDQVQ